MFLLLLFQEDAMFYHRTNPKSRKSRLLLDILLLGS